MSVNARVIIPHYRLPLKDEELISLSTVRKHIPGSMITFVSPTSLPMSSWLMEGESIERFDDSYFQSIEGYNRLLTSSLFYKRFQGISHLLICQLDCLIFSNEVNLWSKAGFDYIAAPWFRDFMEDPSQGLWRVGNGGFSLRNVDSHLRVLQKKIIKGSIYPKHGSFPWNARDAISELGIYEKMVPWFLRMNPLATWTTVEEEVQRHPRNEDLFWGIEAPKFDSTFKVATADQSLPFAFEMAPRWCYEKNERKLPFGCHAWARYDRVFWEEILKNPGY
jgi:hypothetical protein